jgi:hypothetical protein
LKRISHTEITTATYDSASSAKHHPSPTAAMMMPPIDGPMMRLPFTIEEFRAIAFGTSRRSSTISTTSACRAGVSNALIAP